MRFRTSLLTRCVAFALAMILAASFVDAGALLQAFADAGAFLQTRSDDSDKVSVTAGALVAENYGLTDAEKALLSSGLLAGDTYKYSIPSNAEELIDVDVENAKITAKAFEQWVPTVAHIVAAGETVETVALTDGVGFYDPAVGNAFSVKVDYELSAEVPEADQQKLLNASAWLKGGIENLKAGYAADVNLGVVVMAMDTMIDLADGIKINMGFASADAKFGADAIAAVKAMKAQMDANGGKLKLQVMHEAYVASASKVRFLVENGAAYQEELTNAYNYVSAVKNDPLANNALLDAYLQGSDPSGYTRWLAFKDIMENLTNALAAAANADWTVVDQDVVKSGLSAEDYAKLDTLVQALGSTTDAPAVKNPLKVAKVSLQKNMSMFNVAVNVVLKVVEDKADSADLVVYGQKSIVLTLAENMTAAEVLTEINASGIVDSAKAAWGEAYVAAHYAESTTDLPASLNQDITYTVTYSPVEYTVSYDYTTTAPISVPYGYQMTLPAHSDPTQAYDYFVNGTRYAQGQVYQIVDNTDVSRTSGKAYVSTDLYTIVANNYGDEITKAILTSGALKNNVVIAYREPDPADAASLLKLVSDVLSAKDYSAEYAGLKWNPYTYGTNGYESLFSGTTADWTEKAVKVQYKLELTNFSKDEVAKILALAAALKSEADTQKETLDRLAAYYDTMGQLDKTKLGALNGVIDVTDFTPGDGTDADAANIEMRAYFKGIVGGIIANNLDTNNQLKIYNMLGKYNAEGLRYYYNNSTDVINEINSLSDYLTGLLADDEKVAALEIMVGAAGYPEYAEKIADLEHIMSSVKAALTAPNAAIDLTAKNLGKLVDALSVDGDATSVAAGHPYLLSKMLTAMDSSQVMVQVILEAGSNSATVTTAAMDRGVVLTQGMVNELKAAVDAKVAQLLGGNVSCYDLLIQGTPVDELVGVEVDENLNIYYTYTAKSYTVKMDGEADQIITVDNLEIDLPKHPTAGWTYKYTVDGVEGITTSTYTFTVAQLNTLFVDGTYTVTRTEINEAEEKLEGTFADWLVKDAEGNVIGLHADVAGDKNGIMNFAMTMIDSGYTYIGLNGEPLLYLNEENTLEVCLQTLINAILKDNTFSNETLIALGKNGKGKLVAASLQLGNAPDEIFYNDLEFIMNLTSVPSQMGTVARGLTKIKPYMTFRSQDGVMNVELNLPEKVYEVYLTALLATGHVDKNDINAINSEIAYEFLWDYVEAVLATDADTTTYTNTLAKLGQTYDLTGAEKYYQMVKSVLTDEGVEINPDEDGIFDMKVTAKSKAAINKLIAILGLDTSAYDTYLAMVKEYKYDDAVLSVAANATLKNTDSGFEAALLDLNASGIANKFDYTNDLPARVKAIADKAAVILLDDVVGNLDFKGTTILDLNGKKVDGSITSKGNLVIVDSYLDAANGGYVTGSVSGNVIVLGGKYDADVTAFLKDGFKQVDGVVRNALYTLESDGTNVTVVVNTDVMSDESVDGYIPNARALAVDIAAELVMNYFTTAALSADGNVIFDVNVDDILDLITGSDKVDKLIEDGLNSVNVPGMSDFANIILADLLDFAALETAIANDEPVATYKMTTAPWAIEVKHITKGDYVTLALVSNPELAKSFDISLKLDGENKAKIQKLCGALADIVNAEALIDLEQPVFDAAKNEFTVVGTASLNANVDLTVDEDYLTVLTVILANGNPANKADLVAALNAGDKVALKAAIDELSVEDVFTALKKMGRNVSFKAMANKVGVTVNVDHAAELESVFHLILCGAGAVLEKLDIDGRSSKLGALDSDNDGIYEWNTKVSRNPDASARGYTVYAEASASVGLRVNLFGKDVEPECRWGDANHDGFINGKDATMVLQYYAGVITGDELCLLRTDVNGDGSHDGRDATLILQYYAGVIGKFPVEE